MNNNNNNNTNSRGFLKTPPTHIKAPPIKRARQDDPKDTNLIRAKPNPATKNAPETQKNIIFYNAYKY